MCGHVQCVYWLLFVLVEFNKHCPATILYCEPRALRVSPIGNDIRKVAIQLPPHKVLMILIMAGKSTIIMTCGSVSSLKVTLMGVRWHHCQPQLRLPLAEHWGSRQMDLRSKIR